jgi:hypothetical protein
MLILYISLLFQAEDDYIFFIYFILIIKCKHYEKIIPSLVGCVLSGFDVELFLSFMLLSGSEHH